MEACHNDGTRTNNHPNNLRWGSHSENMRDRNKHGTQNTGERNGMHKFSEAVVKRHAELKGSRRKARKGSTAILIQEFGLTARQIHDLTGKYGNWKHLS